MPTNKQTAKPTFIRDSVRILVPFIFLTLNMFLQSIGFAADILCVDRVVPKELVAKAVMTDEAKKTIVEEYRKSLGGPLPEQAVCNTLAIVGVIKAGDFDAVAEVYRGSKGWLQTVALVSPGGNLDEGMRIGRLIRKALLRTYAPIKLSKSLGVVMVGNFSMEPNPCVEQDCVCASTCFVVWVAGSGRYGNYLGIHRPKFESKYFGELPPREAEKLYERAIQNLEQYLQDMDVPQAYYELLMKTPSWDVLIPWQLINDDLRTPPSLSSEEYASPAIDEWLAAKCGAIKAEEITALENYHKTTNWKYYSFFGSYQWRELPDPAHRLLAKKIHEVDSCRWANRRTVVFDRYQSIVSER